MSRDSESGYDDDEVASWTVWMSLNPPVSNGSGSERLTRSLTVGGDLQKRQSAQR